MRWQIPLVVVLATFVAVSCDQQPVEPAAEQVAEAPAFNFMNGPETAGPHVVRYDAGWVTYWDFPPETTPDGEAWTVVEGIDHTDNMGFCGGEGTDTPLSTQDLLKEDRLIRREMRKKGPAYAFHSDDFYDSEGNRIWCGIMDLQIAAGTGSYAFNSSDVTGSITNTVWGGTFNAWLIDGVTGEKYHATSHWKWQWRPDGSFFRVLTEKMHIK